MSATDKILSERHKEIDRLEAENARLVKEKAQAELEAFQAKNKIHPMQVAIDRLEREKAELVELVRQSIRYLDMVASPDGSGHGDLARIIEAKLAELGGE